LEGGQDVAQFLGCKFEEGVLQVGVEAELVPELGVVIVADDLLFELVAEEL
jgi:hypothetical protein